MIKVAYCLTRESTGQVGRRDLTGRRSDNVNSNSGISPQDLEGRFQNQCYLVYV